MLQLKLTSLHFFLSLSSHGWGTWVAMEMESMLYRPNTELVSWSSHISLIKPVSINIVLYADAIFAQNFFT